MNRIYQFISSIAIYKKTFLLLPFLFYISKTSYAQPVSDTLYKEAAIYSLLDQIDSDETLQLEWLTALHFHKLLNDYRNSKNKKSIFWDHKLWMAARNHNVYLLRDLKRLSHTEISSKPLFSGNRPQDRVEYVTYNSKEFNLAGFENCFEMTSLDQLEGKEVAHNTINEIAIETAESAFESWQTSQGHNQNMLDSEHIAHGTSFIYGGSEIYATSVFTGKQKYYEPDSIFLPFLSSFVDTNDFFITPDYQGFSLPKNTFERLNYKYFYFLTQFFKDEGISANPALYKVTQLKKIPKEQKELNKVYRKERGFKGFFELLTYKTIYFHSIFQMSFEDYKQLKGANRIKEILQEETKNIPTDIKYWGGDILAKKTDAGVNVELVVMLLVKKK